FDRCYTGGGAAAFTDGFRGRPDHRDAAWQGYLGPDLEATIDLGEARPVASVEATFLQSTTVGIWLPASVEVAVSRDGKAFRALATVKHDVPEKQTGPLVKALGAPLKGAKARYVRLRAKSVGKIPAWHRAGGVPAWLFADEIVVTSP
ncbi:MAG: discoidin domain-containing protein, partial [Planctomycetota bacterium]